MRRGSSREDVLYIRFQTQRRGDGLCTEPLCQEGFTRSVEQNKEHCQTGSGKKTLRVLERRGIFGRADDGQEHFTAIRPPKFGDVEVSRVRQLCHPICQFQSVAKVSQGSKHDGSGKIRICLHRDWRQSHLFFLRLDSKGLGTLRRCLQRTSPLVRKLYLRQHGDRWKNAMSKTGKKLLVETFFNVTWNKHKKSLDRSFTSVRESEPTDLGHVTNVLRAVWQDRP